MQYLLYQCLSAVHSNLKHITALCFILLLSPLLKAQKPTITSFSPTSGPVGSTVTITGTNFSSIPSQNAVYIGMAKAVLTSASATQLTAIVPAGASYQPITVSKGGLTASSTNPFIVTFDGGGAFPEGAFFPRVDFPNPSQSWYTTGADVDGDGKTDMLAIGAGNVQVYRNESTLSTMSFPTKKTYFPTGGSRTFSTGDVSGDGLPDFVTINYQKSLSIFINTSIPGAISFEKKTDIITLKDVRKLVIMDIDNDGRQDICTINTGDSSFSVYRNISIDTVGFAAKQDFAMGKPVADIAVADMDGDANPEVVLASSTNILLLKNTSTEGNITFAPATAYSVIENLLSVTTGDLNGDGKLDIIPVSSYGPLQIFKNISSPGNPGFIAVSTQQNVPGGFITISDLDGDGKPDICGLDYKNAFVVLKNVTAGTDSISFDEKKSFATGSTNILSLFVGDLNGDGQPEACFTSYDVSDKVFILRNRVTDAIIPSFTPTTGGYGTLVKIKGAGFTGASRVSFGDITATSFTVTADTAIEAIVGTGASGNVTVNTPTGLKSKAGFVFTGPAVSGPRIESFTPESGAAGSTVTITGANFGSTPESNIVYFGAVRATVISASTGLLKVIVPASATYRPISVTNNNFTGFSNKPFNITFGPGTAFSTAIYKTFEGIAADYAATDLGAGDLDGDQLADLAVLKNQKISIYKNVSKIGGIALSAPLEIPVPDGLQKIITADIDGDGRLDLLANNTTANSIYVFRNISSNGTLSFAAYVEIATVKPPVRIAVHDIDLDGKPDIIAAIPASNAVAVFRNTGASGIFTFAPRVDVIMPNFSPSAFAVGDIDGDGKPDIAINNASNLGVAVLTVLRNTTSGNQVSFIQKDTSFGEYLASDIAISDIDNDGKPDIIGTQSEGNVTLYQNRSIAGSLSFRISRLTLPRYLSKLNVADIDGDGRPDLAIAFGDKKNIAIVRNTTQNNTPTFDAKIDLPAAINASPFLFADFDGDSKPDIAAVQNLNNNPLILRNRINEILIDSLYPQAGGTGSVITVWGNGLSAITQVSFGDTAAASFNIISDTLAKAVIGAGGAGIVKITSAGKQGYYPAFKFYQLPVVTGFSPLSGPAGTQVTITGKYFSTDPATLQVFFGAARASIVSATTTSITVTVPPGATYEPVTVANQNLITVSRQAFSVTYPNGSSQFSAGSFAPKVVLNGPREIRDNLISDLDGDGKPDIITISDYNISIFQNNSAASTLSFAPRKDMTINLTSAKLMVRDLNADGKPDLIAGNDGYSSFYLNTSSTGSISFTAQGQGYMYYGVGVVADFDHDGLLDLAAPSTDSMIAIFRNVSTPTRIVFEEPKLIKTGKNGLSGGMGAGELNKDGLPDLVAINRYTNTISVFKNVSSYRNFSFTAKTDYTTGREPDYVMIADLDDDGNPDITVANYNGASVSIFRNMSAGDSILLAPRKDISFFGWPQKIVLSNLDGDKKPDLAIASFSYNSPTGSVQLFKNTSNSDGISFKEPVEFATASYTDILSAGDLNGDAKPDLVFTNLNSNQLSILRNTIYEADPIPVITSFTPVSAAAGTAVVLNGTNFSSLTDSNHVYFGATKAMVTAASPVQLTATVPQGATYAPVSVTANGFTGAAAVPFILKFAGGGTAFTQNSFDTKKDINLESVPGSGLPCDMNLDGKPDIVITNPVLNTISVFQNTSTKRLISFASPVAYSAGNSPNSICAADMDGDGKLDVAAANEQGGTVSVYRNTTSGTGISLAASQQFPTGNIPASIQAGDLSGDGRPDIIVSNSGSETITVLKNTSMSGNISFESKDFDFGSFSNSIAICDLDGDGKPDLVGCSGSYEIVILKNTSTGNTISFAPIIRYTTNGIYPLQVTTGDFDGDGKPDLAVTFENNTVSVFKNNGSSGTVSFVKQVTYPAGKSLSGIFVNDLDGDGKADLAVTNAGTATVSLLKNISTASSFSFLSKTGYLTGKTPSEAMAVDLDGDGKPDMAVVSGDKTLSLLRNTAGEIVELCPGGNGMLASGTIGSSYHWQLSTDSGKTFNSIVDNSNYLNSNTPTLQLNNMPSSFYNYQYRCVVDGNINDPFTIRFTSNWLGTVDTLWDTPGNWSCGKLPDGNTDIIINSGNVQLDTNGVCRSLTVQPGATFTVKSGYTLTVTH